MTRTCMAGGHTETRSAAGVQTLPDRRGLAPRRAALGSGETTSVERWAVPNFAQTISSSPPGRFPWRVHVWTTARDARRAGVTLTTDHLSGSGIWRSSVTHEVVRVDHHLIEDLVDPTRPRRGSFESRRRPPVLRPSVATEAMTLSRLRHGGTTSRHRLAPLHRHRRVDPAATPASGALSRGRERAPAAARGAIECHGG